jgi:hypothetical protein
MCESLVHLTYINHTKHLALCQLYGALQARLFLFKRSLIYASPKFDLRSYFSILQNMWITI